MAVRVIWYISPKLFLSILKSPRAWDFEIDKKQQGWYIPNLTNNYVIPDLSHAFAYTSILCIATKYKYLMYDSVSMISISNHIFVRNSTRDVNWLCCNHPTDLTSWMWLFGVYQWKWDYSGITWLFVRFGIKDKR